MAPQAHRFRNALLYDQAERQTERQSAATCGTRKMVNPDFASRVPLTRGTRFS
jgi:hypothetical protein